LLFAPELEIYTYNEKNEPRQKGKAKKGKTQEK
jgi:hypothetical protein